MPLTRAISARLRTGPQRQPAPAPLDAENEDIVMIKARAKTTSASVLGATRALVAGALSQLNVQSLSSNKASSSCSTGSAPPTTSSSSRPRYVRAGSSRFSSRSSTGSRRSVLGSSEFGDSSDDENGSQGHSRRLGGCSYLSSAAHRPDDCNKENVAPFRCASQDVLETEARNAQEEDAVRRITSQSRQGSLVERQSFSGPSASLRRLSRSSTTSDLSTTSALNMPRTPSRRHARSSSSIHHPVEATPTRRPSTLSASGRKRSRNDVDLDHDALPASPLSRLRIETPSIRSTLDTPSSSRLIPDEDSSSYFPLSSQDSTQSSLFDTRSVSEGSSAATSSCSSDRDVSPPIVALLESGKEKYSSVYAHARALLRYAAGVDPAETEAGLTIPSSAGGHHVKVVGRESERVAIQLFLHSTFSLDPSAPAQARTLNVELDGDSDASCLYVCGLPGTGKTALVRSVLNSLPPTSSPRVAFVNCMTLSHPRHIFSSILTALGSNVAENQSDAFAESALSNLIHSGQQRILIVLDEMDHLLQSRAHQNILYKIFSWTAGAGKCGLVGIANSLDLTERFVPLLASKGASPALLHFRPFEAGEIVSVIRDRLSGLQSRYDDAPQEEVVEDLPLFTPTAVELLAKKIAGATGDLRKALDAARLAVELVEGEQRKKALSEAERVKVSSPTEGVEQEVASRANLLRHLTPSSAPKVTPTQILKVLTSVLGSPNLSKVRSLGVHPKLVLLAILIAQARAAEGLSVLGSTSTSTTTSGGTRIADVESTYHALLRQEQGLFSPLEGSELLGVFDMLEVNSVVRITSEIDSHTSSSSAGGVVSSSVSPSGKRAAKKQLLASSRLVYLAMSADDVQRGICTSGPATGGAASGGNVAVAETIARVYAREKDRAVKAKVYHSIAQENARIRQDELGGGRMGVPVGEF